MTSDVACTSFIVSRLIIDNIGQCFNGHAIVKGRGIRCGRLTIFDITKGERCLLLATERHPITGLAKDGIEHGRLAVCPR